jgi:L-threonylcarbamoyladenylate synthase
VSSSPTSGEIERAASLLRAGRLVVFPTETVYGLGANALDPEAVARIYAVKGRPATSPLIVHVASVEMAKSLVDAWPKNADLLTTKFWPGPLTLVLPKNSPPKNPQIPDLVTAGLPTVALRMPAHPVALALLRAAGLPLAAPSANRFTQISPTTAEHVRQSLGNDVDLILDGGPCQVGIESTVLSVAEPQPVLLRPGAVSRRQLEAVLCHSASPIQVAHVTPAGAHPSPGMHARHYSPRTSLLLVTDGKLPEQGKGIYLQHSPEDSRNKNSPTARTHSPADAEIQIIPMPQSAEAYAAALYGELHRADKTNADWIAVDEPPNTPEWEAVRDRLRRAATNK